MLLRDLLRRQGDFLFRRRSYLPLVLVPLAAVAIWQGGGLERRLGAFADSLWELAGLGVALAGLAIRAATVGCAPAGTSGRTTRRQAAATLNTTGLYSVTRNPLYLGNFLVILGMALSIKVWWLALIVASVFALYYERIIYAEEAFLEQKFGTVYTDWAGRTPLFIPNPRLWRRAALPFSLRTALRREFNGFYLIVVSFVLIEFADDTLLEGETLRAWSREDFAWIAFLGFGTLVWLVLRTLKKHTRVLSMAGR